MVEHGERGIEEPELLAFLLWQALLFSGQVTVVEKENGIKRKRRRESLGERKIKTQIMTKNVY